MLRQLEQQAVDSLASQRVRLQSHAQARGRLLGERAHAAETEDAVSHRLSARRRPRLQHEASRMAKTCQIMSNGRTQAQETRTTAAEASSQRGANRPRIE